jgi:hypothetical protein
MDHTVGSTDSGFDEQLTTLLLLHLIGDAREGWAGWGHLCFVNKV